MAYSIRAVSEKTGLSAHTIRAWERRYGVLSPDRTNTNRRVYDEHDVERLQLLQGAVAAGHSIGMIAGLSTNSLRHLSSSLAREADLGSIGNHIENCRSAIRSLDAAGFEAALTRASTSLGIDGLLQEVVAPLLGELGQGWAEGRYRIAHEHMASAILRTELERVRLTLKPPEGAPRLLVATPSGQVHELGAQLAAVVGAADGWHVTYLGPNLPASEIAEAAHLIGARAVALSLVYPLSDDEVRSEIRLIREGLGPDMAIFVGGRAAASYSHELEKIGAHRVESLDGLRQELGRLLAK